MLGVWASYTQLSLSVIIIIKRGSSGFIAQVAATTRVPPDQSNDLGSFEPGPISEQSQGAVVDSRRRVGGLLENRVAARSHTGLTYLVTEHRVRCHRQSAFKASVMAEGGVCVSLQELLQLLLLQGLTKASMC